MHLPFRHFEYGGKRKCPCIEETRSQFHKEKPKVATANNAERLNPSPLPVSPVSHDWARIGSSIRDTRVLSWAEWELISFIQSHRTTTGEEN